MRRQIQSQTTLGELIAALSKEVERVTLHRGKQRLLVAYILKDLCVRRQVRFKGAAWQLIDG